ncbi:hypothetical protein KY336_03250 [Candidatus Woesearchaeota archaeon]|nr:hypothetical protein [Candidatus Woesearchaeota archaeon]
MSMFKKWFEGLFTPLKTLPAIKREANMKDAVLYILIASAIYGVIGGILIAILPTTSMTMGYGMLAAMMGLSVVTLAVMFLILIVIGAIVGLFVQTAIFHLFAYLFGARAAGGFTKQLYLNSVFRSALFIIMIVAFVPLLGVILAVLLGLYSLFPLTVAIKEAYDFTWGKAVLTWVIPTIIIVVLYVVMLMALLAPVMF